MYLKIYASQSLGYLQDTSGDICKLKLEIVARYILRYMKPYFDIFAIYSVRYMQDTFYDTFYASYSLIALIYLQDIP